MKRLYIAAALLILLLGASLTNGWYARKVTGEMCKELRQAQLLAEVEDWSQAESITRQVYEDWQGRHFYFHTLMPTPTSLPSWSFWLRWSRRRW